MSHFGVDVAPQIPTDLLLINHDFSISSGDETKWVSGFTFLQTENSIFPLELSFPLTKIIVSCFLANAFKCGSLLETWPQIVLFTSKCRTGSIIPLFLHIVKNKLLNVIVF